MGSCVGPTYQWHIDIVYATTMDIPVAYIYSVRYGYGVPRPTENVHGVQI
jgi:hypothetical protein